MALVKSDSNLNLYNILENEALYIITEREKEGKKEKEREAKRGPVAGIVFCRVIFESLALSCALSG